MKIIFRCDPALIDVLPRPQPAAAALPAWLREMAPRVESPLHGRAIRTVKQCPPFVDAMRHGFMILLPCDVHVQPGGRFEWDWPIPKPALHHHPRAPLSFHVPEQIAGTPLAQGDGQAAIKFNSFWTIELEPGWSLMAVHPLNRVDLPFRTLSGLVDADRFSDAGINFPALWTDAGFCGTLVRGTPVAQCFGVPRGGDTLQFEAMDSERQALYEGLAREIMAGPGVYRKRYRDKRRL